nr:DNA alkylation repair enzyme family protein [Rhodococcus sp. JVH1]
MIFDRTVTATVGHLWDSAFVTSTADDLKRALDELSDAADAVNLARFFKTGPGEYGEGDVFIGVRVPGTRSVVRAHADLDLPEVTVLLDSPVHEHRLAGLLVLATQFDRAAKAGDDALGEKIASFYLDLVLRGRVNNWDLVDSSADRILGAWLYDRPRDPVFALAADDDLWRRRVALLSTFGSSAGVTLPRHSRSRSPSWVIAATSRRRRRAGCCARSVSGSTATCSPVSSTGTLRRWAAPR